MKTYSKDEILAHAEHYFAFIKEFQIETNRLEAYKSVIMDFIRREFE